MLTFILEAALRSLLMAVAVWSVIHLLRVRAVLAQKVTWVLVLLAAGTMPLVMHVPWLKLQQAIQIRAVQNPLERLAKMGWFQHKDEATTRPAVAPSAGHAATVTVGRFVPRSATRTSGAREHGARRGRIDRGNRAAATPPVTLTVSVPNRATQAASPRAEVVPQATPFWTMDRVRTLLVFGYFGICGVLLMRVLIGLVLAMRVWLRARDVGGISSTANATVRVRMSRDVDTPLTVGSTILLPADYRTWDQTKLRVVLAHEHSHVRQGDFYLQLLAAIHAAIFWFSPLGWWLKRTLTELGEALSDRAGLEQAPNAASYAQVLLEFAAMPRRTPLAGVAMARSSNLSTRIDRILNDRRFRGAFQDGRRHAIVAALLVPAALVATVACVRFVPSVEAAQATQESTVRYKPAASVMAAPAATGSVLIARFTQEAPAAPSAPVVAPPAPAPPLPAPPAPAVKAPEAPEADEMEAPEPPTIEKDHGFAYVTDDEEGRASFAIVSGNKSNVYMSGRNGEALAKAKAKYKGDFIWFERDGKSYVITDPKTVAEAKAMFKGNEQLEIRQKELQHLQAKLDEEMAAMAPEIAKASQPGPEFAEQMAKLNAELAELNSDHFKKEMEQFTKEMKENKQLTDGTIQKLTQERLGELQERIGDIQGRIGEMQGEIGERQGRVGEKQGEIGERMGKIGEQMGEIGEQQGRMAEEASRKLKSVFDQAVKDGRAKPVE